MEAVSIVKVHTDWLFCHVQHVTEFHVILDHDSVVVLELDFVNSRKLGAIGRHWRAWSSNNANTFVLTSLLNVLKANMRISDISLPFVDQLKLSLAGNHHIIIRNTLCFYCGV
jgi:hypothetical protein